MLLFIACTTTPIHLGESPNSPEILDSVPTLTEIPPDTNIPEDTGSPPDDQDLYAPDSLWELSLTLSDDAYRDLQRNGRSPVPATLAWQGRSWEVQINIKGSSSYQDISQKPSLIVDINAIVPDQEFMQTKKFYLHNDCYDPSQMSETLAYGFYREWGYPASRTSFAHLDLNGEDYGFYTIAEPHNDDFLQQWFSDPNGNLYENADAYCDVTDVNCMEKEEVDEGDDQALIRFGQAANAPADQWLQTIQPMLNWDNFIAYLALEAAIVHWDSYSYDLSNYQLYHEPSTDQWSLLTQSMDLDFGFRPWSYPNCGQYGMDIDKYNMGMLAKSCQNNSDCHHQFIDAMAQYADWLELADGATRVRELDARIGNWVKADPRRYYSDSDYDDHVACLQQFFEDRPSQIRAWVEEANAATP